MTFRLHSTIFGKLLRLLSQRKLLQYPDEIDPSLWKKALRRDVEERTDMSSGMLDEEANNGASPHSQLAQHDGQHGSGQDILLVDWYGPDDPEVMLGSSCDSCIALLLTGLSTSQNPQNWPNALKHLVTFQICLLNFAVYLASSIYVPGEAGFMEEFGVSDIVATLGLSLFTL